MTTSMPLILEIQQDTLYDNNDIRMSPKTLFRFCMSNDPAEHLIDR